MKKFLKMFVLCLMAICCSFAFVACGPTDDGKKEDNQVPGDNTEQAEPVTKAQVEQAVETIDDNYTIDASVSVDLDATLAPMLQTLLTAKEIPLQFDANGALTIDGFKIKRDGDNVYLLADIEDVFTGEIYVVDGVAYERKYDAENERWDNGTNELPIDITEYLDIAGKLSEIHEIMDLFGLESQVSYSATSYTTVYDLTDVVKIIQKVAGVVLTDIANEEATLETFINDLFVTFNVTIEDEEAENGIRPLTVADVLEEVQNFDEETTFADVVAYINTLADTDLNPILEIVYNKFAGIVAMMTMSEEDLVELEAMPEVPTYAEFMATPVLAFVEGFYQEEVTSTDLVNWISFYTEKPLAYYLQLLMSRFMDNGEYGYGENIEIDFEDENDLEQTSAAFVGTELEENEEENMFASLLPMIAQYVQIIDIKEFLIIETTTLDADGNLETLNYTLNFRFAFATQASEEEVEEAQTNEAEASEPAEFAISITLGLDFSDVGTTEIDTTILENWAEESTEEVEAA